MTPMKVQIKALHDKAFIRPIVVSDPTSRLVIPDSVKERRLDETQLGEVLEVGPGTYIGDHFVEPQVSPGDLVIFGGMAGTLMQVSVPGMDSKTLVIRFTDLFGNLGQYTAEMRAFLEPTPGETHGEEEG